MEPRFEQGRTHIGIRRRLFSTGERRVARKELAAWVSAKDVTGPESARSVKDTELTTASLESTPAKNAEDQETAPCATGRDGRRY